MVQPANPQYALLVTFLHFRQYESVQPWQPEGLWPETDAIGHVLVVIHDYLGLVFVAAQLENTQGQTWWGGIQEQPASLLSLLLRLELGSQVLLYESFGYDWYLVGSLG